MGLLINGEWHDSWYDTKSSGGKFVRESARFRSCLTPDGAPDDDGKRFKAEPGRYHLYVSWACPWAHRTLIFRAIKGLEAHISISAVNALMLSNGWTFLPGPDVIPDSVNGVQYLRDLYCLAKPDYTGRVTVPILWDKQTKTIVSNESSEIIRMFNTVFDHLGAKPGDYYPEHLRAEIDHLNDFIYPKVNNGVYRAGFATTQEAYEEAVQELFRALEHLEQILGDDRPYLCGTSLTEADWRLFTTLIRFDAIYYGHFKCSLKRLIDFPHLAAYTRRLYEHDGVASTVKIEHAKLHYYGSHNTINPTGVVPLGPFNSVINGYREE